MERIPEDKLDGKITEKFWTRVKARRPLRDLVRQESLTTIF